MHPTINFLLEDVLTCQKKCIFRHFYTKIFSYCKKVNLKLSSSIITHKLWFVFDISQLLEPFLSCLDVMQNLTKHSTLLVVNLILLKHAYSTRLKSSTHAKMLAIKLPFLGSNALNK
jgi:hypothetical protein